MPGGRPRGSKDKTTRKQYRMRQLGAIIDGQKTPLEYMLAVMNDTTADTLRRDKMAIAAAPLIHPRLVSEEVADNKKKGKKQQVAEKAEKAGLGTEWGEDLQNVN